MAEIETKDIDTEDYAFTPKEIEENGQKILDYTGVENDKVYLVNKKDILTKKRPSWLPEFDIEGLKKDSFLPITVHDDNGNYYVGVKFKTGTHKENRFGIPGHEIEINDYEQKIYKMNLDVLAASVDYYLKREREHLKAIGSSKKVSLPHGLNKMSSNRYDGMRQLLQFCDNYKDEDREIFKEYHYRHPTSYTPEAFNRQSSIIFREQHAPLLQSLKDKQLDLNLQKQDYIDTHTKGEETSYGEKGSIDVLLADYGVKIKKQNGKSLSSFEIEFIKSTVEKVWNHYGDFSDDAKNYNLVLSYADNCNQHARKAVGLFNPYYKAIGVSFFTDGKNERVGSPDVIFSHEVAHWFDSLKGKVTHNWYASDKDGTLENKIALKYKEVLRKRARAAKENLGDYWYRTCECFARSMEQDYAIKHGIKIDESGYLPEDVYKKEIRPLVYQLLEENRKYFNLSLREKNEKNIESPEYIATNYVLEKLKAAGIEVITDKTEFDRILVREEILQKMQGTLSDEEQKRYFTFNEDDTKKFIEQVNEWNIQKENNKTYNPGKLIEVGNIPPVMKVLGISEVPISVQYSTLSKIIRDNPLYPNDLQGHKLSLEDIYAIPCQLADPVMIFKSRTRNDSFVFFTERKDINNNSILIPLAVDKRKGRIVVNEITSMYGKDNEIEFVKTNISEENLIYADIKRSLEWERECKVQFFTQGLSQQGSNPNILTKDRLVNFISADSRSKPVQTMVNDGTTYGFTFENKIYLNPEIMNSNVAVHEYTHLWDAYTQRTNPELWNKGKDILIKTYIWNEIKNNPDYADIADNEDLLASEVHSRICGKIAQSVLERIAKENGEITKDTVIDWDNEVRTFIVKNFSTEEVKNIYEIKDISDVRKFFSLPMKNLWDGKDIFAILKMEQTYEERLSNKIKNEKMENLSNKQKENTDMEKYTKQGMIDSFIETCASWNLRQKEDVYKSYNQLRNAWEEEINHLKEKGGIKEKQYESLMKEGLPCKEKDFSTFKAKIEAKMLEFREFDKNYNHPTVESEKQTVQKSENSNITYFVKSTAEFDMFADFEPFTGLTAEEAVKKYSELQQKNIACGIGISIKEDSVFDDPDADGITVLVRDNGKETFNVYGDTFVKQLKENNEHSQNVLAAFGELDTAARKAGLSVEDAPYIAEKRKELFDGKSESNVLNLSQEDLSEIESKKPTEEQKLNLVKAGIGATGILDINSHHITYDLTPKSSEEFYPMTLNISFDQKEYTKGSLQYNFLRERLGLQTFEEDVNSKKYERELIENSTASQANSISEEKYGFYFEYNNDENCADIFSSKDGDFVGSIGEGGFGYADDLTGNDPITKIPENDFRSVIELAQRYYDESKKANEFVKQAEYVLPEFIKMDNKSFKRGEVTFNPDISEASLKDSVDITYTSGAPDESGIFDTKKGTYGLWQEILSTGKAKMLSEREFEKSLESVKEKSYSWNEIYENAMGKGYGDIENAVYNTAREKISEYAKQYGVDVESSESPEEAIESFVKEHQEVSFNKDGNVIAGVGTEELSMKENGTVQNYTAFDTVTKSFNTEHADFFKKYEDAKEKYLLAEGESAFGNPAKDFDTFIAYKNLGNFKKTENDSYYDLMENARIAWEETPKRTRYRETVQEFMKLHEDLLYLQEGEFFEIIRESKSSEEAVAEGIRYLNAFGNDGLEVGNLYHHLDLIVEQPLTNSSRMPTGEELKNYISDRYEDFKTVEKLSERDKEVLSCYRKNYDHLYNSDYSDEKVRADERSACYSFDDAIKSSPLFKFYVSHLAEARKDAFTSDREEAAVYLAIKELGLDKDLKLASPYVKNYRQKVDLNTTFEKNKEYFSEENQSTFDNEIDDLISGRLKNGHVFNLGKPGEILQKCGFPKDQRIELAEARLRMKATQGNHPFDLEDVKGLDKALQEPVGVFEYGNKEKPQNVIVNLQKDGKNFLVGVFFDQNRNGLTVSSIRGLFNRDNIDWIRWIQQGKMIYGNKEKIQVLITQQRTNLADVSNKEVRTSSDSYYLDSAENIMQKFGDVNDVFTSEFPEYTKQKDRYKIYRAFNQIYQDLDSVERDDAVMQADEFYDALVKNDTKKIELYESGLLYNDIADKAKEIHKEFKMERGKSMQTENIVTQRMKEENPEVWKWVDYEDGSGSLKNPEGKEVAEYDLTTHEFKVNDGWEQAYTYAGNESAPWTVAEIKSHVEKTLEITDKNIVHEKQPGIGEEQIFEEKIQKFSSMPLDFESVKKDKNILPFNLIENKEKGRVNIKFNPAQKNPYFNDIIKELKANGWKYAPSTQQWYPVKIEDSEKFAFDLQKKYSEKLNDVSVQDEISDFILPSEVNKITALENVENEQNAETGKIRYFDRNYLESKEFTEYFNKNLSLLKNNAVEISEKDAGTVLKALNHTDSGLAEYRGDRLGLDEDKNLVIVTHDKEKTSIRKTNLNELLLIAKEMSEKELSKAKKSLEKYQDGNSRLDETLTDIFRNLYESCVERSTEINSSMEKVFVDYYKAPEMEKSVRPAAKRSIDVTPLMEGDSVGKDSVLDVYPIAKGVYQATLGQTSASGVTSAASFFVVDENIASGLRPELLELMEKHDNRYVVESKYNEPYVLKELIDKNAIPPRDAEYVQKLEDFISSHPEKYAKLYPVNCHNFAESLRKLAVIDKDLHKNSFTLGKQLLSMVEDSDKKKVSEWIIKQGGNTEENMKKLFSSWITGQAVEKDVAKTKQANGYPPRGE